MPLPFFRMWIGSPRSPRRREGRRDDAHDCQIELANHVAADVLDGRVLTPPHARPHSSIENRGNATNVPDSRKPQLCNPGHRKRVLLKPGGIRCSEEIRPHRAVSDWAATRLFGCNLIQCLFCMLQNSQSPGAAVASDHDS